LAQGLFWDDYLMVQADSSLLDLEGTVEAAVAEINNVNIPLTPAVNVDGVVNMIPYGTCNVPAP